MKKPTKRQGEGRRIPRMVGRAAGGLPQIQPAPAPAPGDIRYEKRPGGLRRPPYSSTGPGTYRGARLMPRLLPPGPVRVIPASTGPVLLSRAAKGLPAKRGGPTKGKAVQGRSKSRQGRRA